MEHLNKIELRGKIWSVNVNQFDDARCANLLVVTQCEYFAQDGCKTIETTWHYVTAWEGEGVMNLDRLESGQTVHVVGRLRVRTRTMLSGMERMVHDIVASKIETI